MPFVKSIQTHTHVEREVFGLCCIDACKKKKKPKKKSTSQSLKRYLSKIRYDLHVALVGDADLKLKFPSTNPS
jgi:hypothetical protein